MVRDYLINLLNELKKTPGMKSVFHDWLILEVGVTSIEIKSNFENLSDNPTTIVVDESKDSDLNTKKILETYYEQPKIKSKAMESIGNAYVVAVYKNGNIQIYMADMNNVNIQSGDVGNRIYPDCNIDNPDGDGKLF